MSSAACDFIDSAICEGRENGRMDQQGIYRGWIETGLKKPGKGRRKLADAMGLNPSAVTRILDGTRRVQIDEVPRIAAYLGEEPPALAPDADDSADDHRRPTVPLKGYVAAGARARFLPLEDGEFDRVDAPQGATDKTIALEIRGTSLGEMFDRWIVYFDQVESPVTAELVGKLCVVGLPDGRILVKKVQRAGKGLYDLISETEEPIRSVPIEWAARVKLMSQR